MKQKLSAMKYIKNNKARISVLVVSLSLCFVITYLTMFMLSTTEETFRQILVENASKTQYITLAGSSLGVNINNPDQDALSAEYRQKNLELIEKLKQHNGVKDAYFVQSLQNRISAAVGTQATEVPLLDEEMVNAFIEHQGVKLHKGVMPKHEGEIVLDMASMKCGGYELNDYFDEPNCGKTFRIVGILDCDNYIGCGIAAKDYQLSSEIMVLSDGSIEDISALLHKEGITVRDTYDTVVDVKSGKKELKVEVADVIKTSTDIIFGCILVLLSIALFIVYTMYLRDRHNEWCLYCSIGYSKTEIYKSIMSELLFTFATALLIGSVVIGISMVVVDSLIIKPVGIRCSYYHPKTLGQILCSYVLLIGILQIPVRYALYKIRTIDAMDDELY